MTGDIVPLFNGIDPRYGELTVALISVIEERGRGLLFVGVLGVLRLVEREVMERQRSAEYVP